MAAVKNRWEVGLWRQRDRQSYRVGGHRARLITSSQVWWAAAISTIFLPSLAPPRGSSYPWTYRANAAFKARRLHCDRRVRQRIQRHDVPWWLRTQIQPRAASRRRPIHQGIRFEPTGGVGFNFSNRVGVDVAAFATSANLERKRNMAIAFSIRLMELAGTGFKIHSSRLRWARRSSPACPGRKGQDGTPVDYDDAGAYPHTAARPWVKLDSPSDADWIQLAALGPTMRRANAPAAGRERLLLSVHALRQPVCPHFSFAPSLPPLHGVVQCPFRLQQVVFALTMMTSS